MCHLLRVIRRLSDDFHFGDIGTLIVLTKELMEEEKYRPKL